MNVKDIVKEFTKLDNFTIEEKLVYLCKKSKDIKDGKKLRNIWFYCISSIKIPELLNAGINIINLVSLFSPISEDELALIVHKMILKVHFNKYDWYEKYKNFVNSAKVTFNNDNINSTTFNTFFYICSELKYFNTQNIPLIFKLCDITLNYFALDNTHITSLEAAKFLINFITFLNSDKSTLEPYHKNKDKVYVLELPKMCIERLKMYLTRWHAESKIIPILSVILSGKHEETINFFIEFLNDYERSFLLTIITNVSSCKELELEYDKNKYEIISKKFFDILNLKLNTFSSNKCNAIENLIDYTKNYLQNKNISPLSQERQWVFPTVSVSNLKGNNIFKNISFCNKFHLSIQGKNQLYLNDISNIEIHNDALNIPLKPYNPFVSWCGVCVGEYHKVCDQKNKCSTSFDKETNITYRNNTAQCIEGRERNLYGCLYDNAKQTKKKYDNHLKQIEEKKKVLEDCNNIIYTDPYSDLTEIDKEFLFGYDSYGPGYGNYINNL